MLEQLYGVLISKVLELVATAKAQSGKQSSYFVPSGLDSFCFQDTKDESHLHMAWEQDYHMQDPGRLALFDEYLEMSESH